MTNAFASLRRKVVSSVTIAERMKRSPKSIRSRARALKIVLRRANALEAAKTFARDKER
jgi:hypothetical protein